MVTSKTHLYDEPMNEQFEINLSSAKIAGVRSGSGRAIVFLHAGVADHRMWTPQIDEFGRTHTAIAYDRRGFGKTTTLDVPFRHLDDLEALMNHHELDKAILCGCSQGSRIAIDFALAHPGRAERLVLVGATYTGAPWEEITEREKELAKQLHEAEQIGDLDAINELESHLWLDGPSAGSGRVAQSLRELFLDMNGIALAAGELTKEIEPPGAGEKLSNISCPTLLIEGELDFEMIHQRHQTLSSAIAGSVRVEISGTAHLPSMEKPDQFSAHVRGFLSS